MNRVAITLGSLSITWYSVFILIGAIVAYVIIYREAKKNNISNNIISDMFFWCIIFGILGARIYYVIFNLDYYSYNPSEVIKIWNGGLAIHGGIIAGIIVLLFYSRKYKIHFLKLSDLLVPSLIIGQAIGRWGNFFNSEAHGPKALLSTLKSLFIPDFIIDGMFINGNYYHPTFYYESILCIIGFIILIIIRKIKNKRVGLETAFYFVWYGIIRFLIESLRTDSLMLGNIKMAQVISILMIICGIIILILSLRNKISFKEIKHESKK